MNTLQYDPNLCVGCGMCESVCPHGVFAIDGGKARMEFRERCMECGACQENCPTGAIQVDRGVGCAYAMILGALKGTEPTCGRDSDEDCCSASKPSCCG